MPLVDMQSRHFLRTSGSTQLIPSCECSPYSASEAKAAPQCVVIGFDIGEEGNKPEVDLYKSPESAREMGAHCTSAYSEQGRSPRSALGSLLAGSKVVQATRREEDGLDGTVREDEQVLVPLSFSPDKTKPISNREEFEGLSTRKNGGFLGEDLDVDEEYLEESIFCAASPFSTCCSLDFSGRDFLSVCFFCKGCLTNGNDLYMYKGNEAFCSVECRYQQIVLDEFRERQTAAASCFMGASNRSRKMFTGASTAVA